MEILLLGLWLVLFLIGAFAPMRWSLAAFLCLSAMDFRTGRTGVGGFNLLKGVVLPVYLLWRLKGFSGHIGLRLAPIAWLLLACYAEIAASWSLFPGSAHKLVVQMLASFVILCVYLRAAKAGYLTATTAIWATAGCLALGVIRSAFFPMAVDDPTRFTGFIPAQPFAALLAACYCITLCGKGLQTSTRVLVCSVIAGAIAMNGSRIWFIGIVIASLLNLLLSKGQVWLKVCTLAALSGLLAILFGASDVLFSYLALGADRNRIASAITALHEGDRHSTGLGTLNFRREINQVAIDRIRNSNAVELLFGRGTCNGAMIGATLFPALYPEIIDPNRMMHNEWMRVIYEWGIIGSIFWLAFIVSVIRYGFDGFRIDPEGNAKPLLLYLPAFLFGLAGENIIAGAASAGNMGFIFVIALSSIPHREFLNWKSIQLARRQSYIRSLSARRHAYRGTGSGVQTMSEPLE